MEMNLDDFRDLDTDRKLDKLFEVQIDQGLDIKAIKQTIGMNGNGPTNGNGDCIYVTSGKTKIKIPISKGTLKTIGWGSVAILLVTGQINIHSPLAQEIMRGLVSMIGG